MFDLVLDVEAYPEFLPFCESLEVLSREDTGSGEKVTADMKVGYKQFSETYTSHITTDVETRRIVVACVEGPLKALENIWGFRDLEGGEGSEIDLSLAYKFKNPLMQMAMNALLDRAFDKFLSAFEARAAQTYAQATTPST